MSRGVAGPTAPPPEPTIESHEKAAGGPLWSCALGGIPDANGRTWKVVEELWALVAARPSHAGPVVSEGLRAARTLGSKERPLAGDLLAALLKHPRALARVDADPIVALKRVIREGVPALVDPDDAYAVALSLPDDLASEWWTTLGPRQARRHAEVLAGRAPVTLRVLRGGAEDVELPVPARVLGPRTLVLDARTNLHVAPAWQEGRVEVQDLGSQRIVDAAFARVGAGARVLDLCAGAGGKALALAALGARVQAWDVRPAALRELEKRAGRCGLNVQIAPARAGDRFDLVLVDAPCSGTGVLRRHPENRWKLAFPTEVQAQLLAQALELAPQVVYGTCSLADRENGALVRRVAGEPRAEETVWPGRPLPAAHGLAAVEGDPEGFYWAHVSK